MAATEYRKQMVDAQQARKAEEDRKWERIRAEVERGCTIRVKRGQHGHLIVIKEERLT